jgi:hypothetical protein
MIVFRKQERFSEPQEFGAGLLDLIRKFPAGRPGHDLVVELLIDIGEFEAAVTDAFSPARDVLNPAIQALRSATLCAGEIFHRSWTRGGEGTAEILDRLKAILSTILNLRLPSVVCTRVAEGYAHYGIFPETYLESARRFHAQMRPESAVCVGIRSIGTSLSAVVSAALKDFGCSCRSYTLRPRGHPFKREMFLSSELQHALMEPPAAAYLLIDEGPGLSGSSLGAAAQKLSEMGIPDDRIVFFPCWNPDGTDFLNEQARVRWTRHRKYAASFEDAWIYTGRLDEYFPAPARKDISAGNWRQIFFSREEDYPAVHPHHEQRKYIRAETPFPRTGPGERDSAMLMKFAGLGKYGRSKRERLDKFASLGFSPPALGLKNGFLLMPFISGRPVSRRDIIGTDLLGAMAAYLGGLKANFPVVESPSPDEMMEMMRTNIGEGIGGQWLAKLEKINGLYGALREGQPVALDGRMLPHDWIRTETGFIKTDGLDHHLDQFFPRSQDIAWDIAGACIEFGLDRRQRDFLLERYKTLTGDRSITLKLPYYTMAYLSFRLGYACLCADSLGASSDGRKFRDLAQYYATVLRRLLTIYSAD